jgi:hypothetical protein
MMHNTRNYWFFGLLYFLNQIQFRKRFVLWCSLEYRTMDKVQKPSDPEF